MSTSKNKEKVSNWLETNLKESGLLENNQLISNPRHSNQWFVDISPIQEYLSKLKKIFDDLIDFAYKEKNKSGSRSVLQKLMKQFPKKENSNLEDYIKGVDNLAKKLKSTSWLSFFGSFGASLNSSKSKDLIKMCGIKLKIEEYNIKIHENRIKSLSKLIMLNLNRIKQQTKIQEAVKIFNKKIVDDINKDGWIFRSTPLKNLFVSRIDQYKQINTAWKPKEVPTNDDDTNKEKEELTKRFQELQTIVKADTNHHRYSTEFEDLVDQLITHIELLSS